MKLNIDCIRDLMLWVEDQTTPTTCAVYVDIDVFNKTKDIIFEPRSWLPQLTSQQNELLSMYGNDVLVYHLRYCIEAGLVRISDVPNDGISILIEDLTPLGHNFIGNIRYKTVFDKTKKVIHEIGVETLPASVRIAEAVVSELIKHAIIS